jgi:hypothetical protein
MESACGARGKRHPTNNRSTNHRGSGPHDRATGWILGRKSDCDPGSEVLWRGLTKLRTLTEAWRIFKTWQCG